MSRKTLILCTCILLVGSGLIPSGLIINNLINNEVANSVDEGLLGIQEEAIPLIELMIKEQGIPRTLRGIRDTAIPMIEPMIKVQGISRTLRGIRDTAIPMIEPMIKEKGIPQALRGIRDTGIIYVEDMVEATFVSVLIKVMALDGGTVLGTYFAPIGVERFFNNDTTGTWVIFNGISKYHTEALNFSEDAQNRILYGNSTTVSGYISGIQGLLNDTSTGAGVSLFMNQYHAANSSLTNDSNETMQVNYNCTWHQLTKLYDYITAYLIDVVIPFVIQNNLHVEYMPSLSGLLSVNEIARALFMEQWANGTILGERLYLDGIDFSEIVEGINETLVGFEVGRVTPSNISRNVAYALFDDVKYPHALTNDSGIEQWIGAFSNNTIKTNLINEFNLTSTQMDMILYWLFEESYKDNVVPELMKLPPPDGVGMNVTQYARVLLLEQWANGTILGEVMYPGGIDFNDILEGINESLVGFEVGRIAASNISLQSALALFNENQFQDALTNDGSTDQWTGAINNTSIRTMLINEFNLTSTQMDMIFYWLFEESFKEDIVPELMKLPPPDGVGMNVTQYARVLLLEQWANGTILGEDMYPEGIDFSDILEGVDAGLVGFEVGRITASNIPLQSALTLFDEMHFQDALTNDIGIVQWINAYANDTIKSILLNEFNLTTTQMSMILKWLFEESFMENIVPELMKLPPPDGVGMNVTEYAGVLFLEQWTNGTVNGKVLYPYGFPLELKATTIYGFEIGYQSQTIPVVSTGISLTSAMALWNTANEYSLINNDGLMKWLQAIDHSDSKSASELQAVNNLTEEQFLILLSWLPEFRNKVMPFLAQEEMNLPTDSTSLGNIIQGSLVISGSSLVGLAGVGLTRHFLIRRKRRLNTI
jgi:hypothetical protein